MVARIMGRMLGILESRFWATVLMGSVIAASAWGVLGAFCAAATAGVVVVDFEELPLETTPYYHGGDGAGGFVSRGVHFHNRFVPFGSLGYWEGWAYSKTTDVVTGNWTNQFSTIAGAGADGSAQFGVAYSAADGNPTAPSASSPRINLPNGVEPVSVAVNNTTYAALVMRDGDPNHFSAQFGGDDGLAPDWFLLRVDGLNAEGDVAASVEHFLADYRNLNGAADFIQTAWEVIDLSPLAGRGVRSLDFRLASSDANSGDDGSVPGILTPAYVAIDNLVLRAGGGLLADFDANGVVDANDLFIWQTYWGAGMPGAIGRDKGDANGDGRVDGGDWLVWQQQFGALEQMLGVQNVVPEAGCLSLTLAALAAASATRFVRVGCRNPVRTPSARRLGERDLALALNLIHPGSKHLGVCVA